MTSSPETIYVKTRYGRKLHKASPGSSVTACGHWMKVAARTMAVEVTEEDLPKMKLVLCEKCFSPGERLVAPAPEKSVDEMDMRELLASGLTESDDLSGTKARHRMRYLLRTMSFADVMFFSSATMGDRARRVFRDFVG